MDKLFTFVTLVYSMVFSMFKAIYNWAGYSGTDIWDTKVRLDLRYSFPCAFHLIKKLPKIHHSLRCRYRPYLEISIYLHLTTYFFKIRFNIISKTSQQVCFMRYCKHNSVCISCFLQWLRKEWCVTGIELWQRLTREECGTVVPCTVDSAYVE